MIVDRERARKKVKLTNATDEDLEDLDLYILAITEAMEDHIEQGIDGTINRRQDVYLVAGSYRSGFLLDRPTVDQGTNTLVSVHDGAVALSLTDVTTDTVGRVRGLDLVAYRYYSAVYRSGFPEGEVPQRFQLALLLALQIIYGSNRNGEKRTSAAAEAIAMWKVKGAPFVGAIEEFLGPRSPAWG